MIHKIGLKYTAIVGSLGLFFSHFIACGAQQYKVSLEDDVSPPPGSVTSQASLDPQSPMFGIHAPGGWKSLPIRFYTGANLSNAQVEQLRVAMATWEWALGRLEGEIFLYMGKHSVKTGDSFYDLYSSLEDGQNGHYADQDWGKTQKDEAVLATTIWANAEQVEQIESADIRFNTEHYNIGDSYYIFSDGTRDVVDMLSLSLHELGHLLGLQHVNEDVDTHSVMNPRLFIGEGLAQRSLSAGDIKRVQQIYGCRNEACDQDYLINQTQPSEAYDSQTNPAQFALKASGELAEDEAAH